MVYNVIILLIQLGNSTGSEQLLRTENPLKYSNRENATALLPWSESLWEACVGFAQGLFCVVFARLNKLLGMNHPAGMAISMSKESAGQVWRSP